MIHSYRDFYLDFWWTGQLFNCCGSRDDCLCRRVVQTPSGGTGSPFRSCRYNSERHMMNKHILAMAACLAVVATPVLATDFKVEEATIPELEQAFRDHRLSCHQLVQTYLDRIAAYDKQGPKLNAILTLMYGPAARRKRFSSIWRQQSCINVSGL